MRTPGVGCKTFAKLLEQTTPTQIFQESRRNLVALGLSDQSIGFIMSPDWKSVESDFNWLNQDGHGILTIADEGYPPLLRDIPSPPPLLFINGNADVLTLPQIAIVGSRNPSAQGKQIAEDFARTLVKSGFSICSGLALGIDAASHNGALKGDGFTVAVAGTGPDRIYPACHRELAGKIIENGAIVTEFSPGTTAKASHFPQRNRIISGLSIGLLVVEAAAQSGSLITARMALEQGREVFAIPGSIQNPLARGCNAL
ncbi:MAG: DNA-processing protein DprA, partial [Gammaproteobacteria bacterium]